MIDQQLGRGTRNQGAGFHLEFPAVKRPTPHEVLDRFMPGSPSDQSAKIRELFGIRLEIRSHVELKAFATKHMTQKQFSTDPGGVDLLFPQILAYPVQQASHRPGSFGRCRGGGLRSR